MKLLLVLSITLSQAIWAIGSINLKNVEMHYKNGSGFAKFDNLNIGIDNLNIDVNHLHQLDMSYEDNAYKIIQRFDNKTSTQLTWDAKTDFLKDTKSKIAIKTDQPVQFSMGTRKTHIDIPQVKIGLEKSIMVFDKLLVTCSNPKGPVSPDDFMFYTVKACLKDGQFNLKKMVMYNLGIITDEENKLLEEMGRKVQDLTEHNIEKMEAINHIDITIKDNQVYGNIDIKIGPFKPKLELIGSVSVLARQKKLKIFISKIKLANIAFTNLLFELLKNYESKVIQIKYPYVYVDISGLLTEVH